MKLITILLLIGINSINLIMRFTIALLVLSVTCIASAYKEPQTTECSFDAASKCVTEIGGEKQFTK